MLRDDSPDIHGTNSFTWYPSRGITICEYIRYVYVLVCVYSFIILYFYYIIVYFIKFTKTIRVSVYIAERVGFLPGKLGSEERDILAIKP